MKKAIVFSVFAGLLVISLSTDSLAQDGTTQSPTGAQSHTLKLNRFTCEQYLKIQDMEETQFDVFAVWLHGYWTGLSNPGDDFELTSPGVENFVKKLNQACKAQPKLEVKIAIADMAKGAGRRPQK